MSSLPLRKIGSTLVTTIGYGAMSLGGMPYGPAGTDEERFKLLDRLVELGCTNWDTAPIYGDSETLLGKWFTHTGKRNEIFLATKFGILPAPTYEISSAPESIKQELNLSLAKLQTDHIDLYYQHRPDPKVPIEITMRVLVDFVKEGKIKYIGLSEATPDTIRRAHKVHPISAVQVEYSPFELTLEGPGGVIETARELGISIVAYSPTGRGLATGRYKSPDDFDDNDLRRHIPRFSEKNFPHILNLVKGLEEIGKPKNATAAQVCMAWLLEQGDDIIPIPGSRQIKYNDENLGAARVRLSQEEVKRIRELCKATENHIGGDARMPRFAEDMVLKDTPPLPEPH